MFVSEGPERVKTAPLSFKLNYPSHPRESVPHGGGPGLASQTRSPIGASFRRLGPRPETQAPEGRDARNALDHRARRAVVVTRWPRGGHVGQALVTRWSRGGNALVTR